MEPTVSNVNSVSGSLGHPFRWTRRDQRELPVSVEGQLPTWLKGRLVRTCPAETQRGAFSAQHLFDGLGLIYAFELGEGARYCQQLLASRVLSEAEQGRAGLASFGTSIQRNFMKRLLEPTPHMTDNTNVNVVPWQGKWLAMTETPHQHVVDGASLHSEGLYRYEDKLPRALSMTAHPHFDAKRAALVNVGTTYGPNSQLWVYRQSRNSRERVVEGTLGFKRVPYVHAFGLTDNYAVIIDHPLSVQPWKMLWSNRGFIQHFAWEPQRGTRLWRLDRRSGEWKRFDTEALFCFHIVNTFEEGDELVFDFLAYPDAQVISSLTTQALRTNLPKVEPKLVRARMRPGQPNVQLETLSDVRFEFPQIAYRAKHAQPYRFAWGAQLDGTATSQVVRVDVQDGSCLRYQDESFLYGEPVFVPRPGATAEDDGCLLTVGSHAREERTRLLVLDAQSLVPLATCEAGLSLPLGFHGNFQAQG